MSTKIEAQKRAQKCSFLALFWTLDLDPVLGLKSRVQKRVKKEPENPNFLRFGDRVWEIEKDHKNWSFRVQNLRLDFGPVLGSKIGSKLRTQNSGKFDDFTEKS